MSTHYLGVSTGPIVATLLKAQKTREMWVTSYLLSTLMRHLVEEVNAKGRVLAPVPPVKVIVLPTDSSPAVAPQKTAFKTEELFGAGIYPDRLYASFTFPPDTPQEKMTETITSITEKALTRTANIIKAGKATKVKKYLKEYFRIVHVWLEADGLKEGILGPLNDLLDTQELAPVYLEKAWSLDPLEELLVRPYSARMVRNGLLRNTTSAYADLTAAQTSKGKRLPFDFFPSTAQIASLDLYHGCTEDYLKLQHDIAGTTPTKTDATKEEAAEIDIEDPLSSNELLTEFYRRLDAGDKSVTSELKDHFEDYHKYFCIVHADGDRFGKVIEGLAPEKGTVKESLEKLQKRLLETEKSTTEFSQKLANYAVKAAGIINQYGGKPIYIGGDDLLFFSPVVYGKRTVFDLLAALDKLFEDECKFTPQPSLSYGITLSHYKYPLFEARDHSFNALYAAKHTKWTAKPKVNDEYQDKDAIAFRLIRHSGSYFTGYLDKGMLKAFNKLRAERADPKDADFLSSFTYKLREAEPLLDAIGDDLDHQRLSTIVANLFDEPIHNSTEKQGQLEDLITFHEQVNNLKIEVDGEPISVRDNTYALLRLMAFTLPSKN